MLPPKLSRLELKLMDALWSRGALSIREIQESLPAAKRPGYGTVQTMIYRLEAKNAVRRVRKIGNAHIFEALVSRGSAHRRVLDEVLGIFGGRTQPIMSHWVESGQLTLEDVKAAEREIRRLSKRGKP